MTLEEYICNAENADQVLVDGRAGSREIRSTAKNCQMQHHLECTGTGIQPYVAINSPVTKEL